MPSEVIGLIEIAGQEGVGDCWGGMLGGSDSFAARRSAVICVTEPVEADVEALARELETELELLVRRLGR